MAVPSYATNNNSINNGQSGTWAEMTAWNNGGTPQVNTTEWYIEGSGCVTASMNNKTTMESIVFNNTTGITFGTNDVLLMWHVCLASNVMDTFANGGLRAIIASGLSDGYAWKVGGNDYNPNPYGGWKNVAVWPAWNTSTPDYTLGSPAAISSMTKQYFGSGLKPIGTVSKGEMHCVDLLQYGRGDLVVTAGSLADGYATFVGLASYNDTSRYGLFADLGGNYLWKGLMQLGTSGTAVDFVDANKAIVIDDCPRTYADFNRIEIDNASSSVLWTNVSFRALGTDTPGELEMLANATFVASGCSFFGMGTFILLSNGDMTDCVFFQCDTITGGGGLFTNSKLLECSVTAATGAAAFDWDVATDPDGYLDGMEFTKGANNHSAINFGTTSPLSMTLRGMSFSGFNASDDQADSVLYIARTSGTVNIACVECTGTVSYKSAGATVNITQGVLTKVTVRDADTKALLSGVRVLVEVTDGANFFHDVTVAIVSSGTTATVTHASHGMSTGDKVNIQGANEDAYNGAYTITWASASTYTYTMNEDPASPATGTIKATFVLIFGTTVSGVISDQRPMSSDQPILGDARLDQDLGSPYYRGQGFVDTVDSALGREITVLLLRDDN